MHYSLHSLYIYTTESTECRTKISFHTRQEETNKELEEIVGTNAFKVYYDKEEEYLRWMPGDSSILDHPKVQLLDNPEEIEINGGTVTIKMFEHDQKINIDNPRKVYRAGENHLLITSPDLLSIYFLNNFDENPKDCFTIIKEFLGDEEVARISTCEPVLKFIFKEPTNVCYDCKAPESDTLKLSHHTIRDKCLICIKKKRQPHCIHPILGYKKFCDKCLNQRDGPNSDLYQQVAIETYRGSIPAEKVKGLHSFVKLHKDKKLVLYVKRVLEEKRLAIIKDRKHTLATHEGTVDLNLKKQVVEELAEVKGSQAYGYVYEGKGSKATIYRNEVSEPVKKRKSEGSSSDEPAPKRRNTM
ncbi:acetyl-CoA decarbonylase/synthase complex subunit alpha [Acrasis kona]|uniref:Acetyl-CoA decarbonylase/synthase complex subunit alpha n=1 Tax=Acrasis kona TaxID=1008807 RepID=A0AAW2ZL03_9EUKA